MRKTDGPRGIVHVHTTYSSDGRLTPADIARLCRGRRLGFAALSDHAEDVDEAAMQRLARECEEQSRDGLLVIPGLEHRFQRGVHILALGQDRIVQRQSCLDTLKALSDAGCVLIAAHCEVGNHLTESLLEILTAVEIWNVSRHTRYLPASGCMAAYRQWATDYPNLYAIGGLDMHAGCEWGCDVALTEACESADSVLSALRSGRFSTQGRLTVFGSRPAMGFGDVLFAVGDLLAGVRDIRNRVMHSG